ncbi:MAG: DUF4412 domain-containing protein [Acidobacteria bacterium]|nr:MAG: DUF4412 domain-containing protein [Acidobacteriota bacterium]
MILDRFARREVARRLSISGNRRIILRHYGGDMKKPLSILFIAVLAVAFANADTFIKQTTHTDAFTMMGQTQPARDEIQEIWIGQDQMATVTKAMTVLVDTKRNVLDMINHENKTYVEMALPLDMSQYLPPQFAQMMGATKVTVTPKGTSQQVGDWKCEGYDVLMDMGMMKIKMVSWATTEVPFDWAQVQEKLSSHVMKASMRLDDAAVAEFKKIKGFQVKADIGMEMMGSQMKASTTVNEISTKPAPAGMYAVPAGYTKQDKLSMQDLMKQ